MTAVTDKDSTVRQLLTAMDTLAWHGLQRVVSATAIYLLKVYSLSLCSTPTNATALNYQVILRVYLQSGTT